MRAGTVLHGYKLERRVGSGGFSEVWAATRGGEPAVAVKVPRAPVSEAARARLDREVLTHGLVSHPNICRLEGVLPDRAALVLELLTGPSLASRLASGPLAAPDALRWTWEILEALAAVHHAGVVHRDVTPANILFHGERAKLIDFGIAKIAGDGGPMVPALTSDEAALGSLVHEAPEQIDDPRSVDARADLYGLGSTLFLALAGRPAFRAPTAATLLVLKTARDAPTLGEVTGAPWPADVEAFVAALLARDLRKRVATARDALAMLSRLGTR